MFFFFYLLDISEFSTSVILQKKFASEKVLLGNFFEIPVVDAVDNVEAAEESLVREVVLESTSNASSSTATSSSIDQIATSSFSDSTALTSSTYSSTSSEDLRDGAFNIPEIRITADAAFNHSNSSSSESVDTLIDGSATASKRGSVASLRRRSKSSTPTASSTIWEVEGVVEKSSSTASTWKTAPNVSLETSLTDSTLIDWTDSSSLK